MLIFLGVLLKVAMEWRIIVLVLLCLTGKDLAVLLIPNHSVSLDLNYKSQGLSKITMINKIIIPTRRFSEKESDI